MKVIIKVEGMTCRHCEMAVENAVKKIPNVINAKANHQKKEVEVEYEHRIQLEEIYQAIEDTGYTPIRV
ncbi:MAG: cation transporter [Leptospiraceae bacterium]|nr:cation transporter [Leptospiraceae bacterium]MDW7975906.1 cation transporter [Leptospiraceae bacterium]